MQSILSTSLQLGEAISNAVFAYADAVGCDNTCNKYELAILQWANNSVIQGLVNKGYVTAPSNSVNDLFTGFCGYPEFQVYTSTLLPDTFVTGLPSFGQFSILNQYTVMNFLYNYNHQNYNYLENFYGLNQMQQEQLFKYLGYIFGNYYYGLGTCGFMTVINAYDLIWGFNESRVTEVQEGPLFGGQMYYSPLIQLGKGC